MGARTILRDRDAKNLLGNNPGKDLPNNAQPHGGRALKPPKGKKGHVSQPAGRTQDRRVPWLSPEDADSPYR